MSRDPFSGGSGRCIDSIFDPFDSDSIFNDYGNHGSEYAADSVWNEYGTYGGEYSALSASNPYTSSPPLIVRGRRVIGRLTVNKYLPGAVNPYVLKGLLDE